MGNATRPGSMLTGMVRRLGGWALGPALLAYGLLALQPGYSVAATVTLEPVADAYVLDGAWANSNFGTANPIFTQTRKTSGQNYDSYLKFDLSGVGSIASAKLRISASVAGPGVGTTAYAVADTPWSEGAITWNNKPARGAALSGAAVASVSYVYYELDVSDYVLGEKIAGRNLVSFALHNPDVSSQAIYIQSREATSSPPQLVITLNTVVSLVPVTSSLTLGAGTTLILTVAAAQGTDTPIPLAATPAGIVSVPAQVVVPAGQVTVGVAVTSLALGQAAITASLNGANASALVAVVPPPPRLTALEPATLTMRAGATASFTVRISATQNTHTEIALATDNPAVLALPATVTVAPGQLSATFTATALAAGNAVIAASLDGVQKSAAVQVTTQAVQVVSLVPSPLPLQQGAVGALTVNLNAAPEVDTAIALANGAPAVVQVPATVTVPAGATSATVPVHAAAPGSAIITASANATSASATVEVAPTPPVVTALAPATLTLPKGVPGVLRVAVSRAPNVATAVALASSNPAAAQVPATVNVAAGGLFADIPVAALAEGQATITASLNGGSASAVVTVTAAELVTLTLSPAPASAYIGESVPFTATGTLTDGTMPDFTTRVTWTSSNTAVATIAATGVASALAQGQTTITASFSFTAAESGQPVTITAATTLTVKQPVALVLSAPVLTLQVGASTTVTVSSSDPAPGGGLVVTLTQSGTGSATFPATVTIPANGTSATFTVTGAAPGQVTITATAMNRLPGSITFTITPQLAITAIAPTSGPVGTLVTLTGTGFDPLPANNQIVFRGINNTTVSGAALTATATQITVRVPALADTGPITLTNSRGTVSSPVFTVTREQDYQLVVSPATLTVFQGASSTAQAQLASTGTRQFTGLVTLSVQGLPAGVTASFSPAATLSAFQAGAITFGASAAAAPGSYPVTVQASFTENGVPFVRSGAVSLTIASGSNVTGVKGRFVTPENQGIAGVIVRADIVQNPQPQATTDAAGNFTLVGLAAGPVTLRFDATPANPLYPIWPYTTTLIANQVIVIPDWTINPPPPDDKFTPITANSGVDQIVTDPRFPGLEIKIPAGTTILGWDGVPKSRIAVERLDPDKLPVTAPPISTKSVYQLYFGTAMGGLPSNPIPVTLPNDIGLDPGTQTELWFYDGSPMGGTGEWKLGGTGTVSTDGKVIVTDPGSGIPRFCGVCGLPCFKNNQGGSTNPPPPSTQPQGTCGNPVTLALGQELARAQDLYIDGIAPLSVHRAFNPRDPYAGIAGTTLSLGFGWILNYDVTLLPFNAQQTRIVMPGNERIDFTPDGTGSFENKADPRFQGAKLTPQAGNQWELKFKDGRIWRFQQFGLIHWLTEQRDQNNNSILVTRGGNGKIQLARHGSRILSYSYGANGFISEVTDPIGRKARFTYTPSDRIASVTGPDNAVTTYTYVDDAEFPSFAACPIPTSGGVRLKSILRPGRTNAVVQHYGPGFRVLKEAQEDGTEIRFAYNVVGACVTHISNTAVRCTANCPTVDSWENFQAGWRIIGGQVSATTITDSQGRSATQRFGALGLGNQVSDPQGQQYKYVRDSQNRVTAVTDPLGRNWQYTHDAKGNRLSETDPAGKVTQYTYDSKWNKVTSITRFDDANLPITQTFEYDINTSNLTRSVDPLGNPTTFGYNAKGQLTSITDALNRTRMLGYNTEGDLVSIKDALGNEILMTPDLVGRITAITDPLGFSSRTTFNANDQVSELIDANQGSTRFAYGAKRDLTSITNPLNNVIESYVRDDRLRLTQKTDAKLKSQTFVYGANGQVATMTDRKGQVTSYTYDESDRVTRVQYPDGDRRFTYDAVGRLASVEESGGVSITYSHDNLNRVVQEVQDSGGLRSVITNEYDALGRRIRRTVDGTDTTTFTYDKASRLTSLTYRGATTTYEWDNANRLTRKTLPNGIVQEMQYDDADRETAIIYKKTDGTVIESVAYTYDARGQRLTRTTSSSSVRETPFTASYDEANRMTSITLTATGQTFGLTYDDNGNLAAKIETTNLSNVTTYTWDSRNRLIGIQSPTITASFKYDGLNRRVERTVNGQITRYVYDGPQAIVEVGSAGQANLLTGLDADEVIARYTQSGRTVYLQDALLSVIAQTKDDQTIQNFYTYTPYGEATTLGPDEGNPIQFTGRENDQTGLYFYRARYYDPLLKRFVTEDPVGIAGGLNLYGYVGGDPVNLIDPTGNASTCYSQGPGCSGAGGSGGIVKNPPGGGCYSAVVRGGNIVGWEPCTPPQPSASPQPPAPKVCPGTPKPTSSSASGSSASQPSSETASDSTPSFEQCVSNCVWSRKFVGRGASILFGNLKGIATVHSTAHAMKSGAAYAAAETLGATALGYSIAAGTISVGAVGIATYELASPFAEAFEWCQATCGF